jgi:uncharacterized protein (TIGR02569 family)
VAPNPWTLAAFGLTGTALALPGGEGRTFRVGDTIVRQEQPEAVTEAAWLASVFAKLHPTGVRLARPLRTQEGEWLAPGNWTAWTCLAGRPATGTDAAAVLAASTAFHAALAQEPAPAFLANRETLYDHADRWAWGAAPATLDPAFAEPITQLLARRRALAAGQNQLIHGDLNPDNILIANGEPPGIIDMAPYWRPAGFAAAVAAYWLGPYRGDPAALRPFAHLPSFDQLLVRAGLRMLFSAMVFGRPGGATQHGTAADLICRYVDRDVPP